MTFEQSGLKIKLNKGGSPRTNTPTHCQGNERIHKEREKCWLDKERVMFTVTKSKHVAIKDQIRLSLNDVILFNHIIHRLID